MRVIQNIRRVTVVGATVIALGGIGTGVALADPPAGTTPALTSIVGVGSDTITPLFSGSPTENTAGSLVTDYNATNPANKLWSWDAVNPSNGTSGDPIVTKGSSSSDAACSIARPNGSSAGITALENSKTDGGDPCIDFARSSRAPQSGDPTTIAFAPYAGDAIGISSPEGNGLTSPVPDNMTVADLASIYTCQITVWNKIPGNSAGSSATIVPVLPQNGSGTRSTFLLALGGGTTPLVPGSCVVNASGTSAIEENTGLSAGNTAQFGTVATSTTINDLFPYSIGDNIAQGPLSNGVGGHASNIWGHGDLALHAMTDDSGAVQQPTLVSGGQTVINQNFPAELQRLLYNVVRNGGTAANPAFPTTPAYEATALPAIFGSNGWLCTNTTAQADIVSYGFFSLGGACGSLTAG
jgi:ABC-type phosphate transport system substrate-binding protein